MSAIINIELDPNLPEDFPSGNQNGTDTDEEELYGEKVIPFDPQQLNLSSRQITIYSLCERIRHREINFLTDFQRHPDSWTNNRKSKLIESILIRFPIPTFYFDGTNDGNWLVIDGLQRLSALRSFIIEQENPLKLQGMEYLIDLEGKTFNELPREYQRRIYETEFHIYTVNAGTPDSIKYNLFKRLNTGGLILTAHEIRNAIYQGAATKFINKLATSKDFLIATDKSISPSRMEDREYILRFLAFAIQRYESYKPTLNSFLNNTMEKLNGMSEGEQAKYERLFERSMSAAYTVFGNNSFRKPDTNRNTNSKNKNPINKALFEAISTALARLSEEQITLLLQRKTSHNNTFLHLLNDELHGREQPLSKAISDGSSSKTNTLTRHKFLDIMLSYSLLPDLKPQLNLKEYYEYKQQQFSWLTQEPSSADTQIHPSNQ